MAWANFVWQRRMDTPRAGCLGAGGNDEINNGEPTKLVTLGEGVKRKKRRPQMGPSGKNGAPEKNVVRRAEKGSGGGYKILPPPPLGRPTPASMRVGYGGDGEGEVAGDDGGEAPQAVRERLRPGGRSKLQGGMWRKEDIAVSQEGERATKETIFLGNRKDIATHSSKQL